MQEPILIAFDRDFGAPTDHKLPIVYLRERRRELVLALEHPNLQITREHIREIAMVHQAIKAIEAVLVE